MKYMIINGSPRKKCNTAQMLASFADGIKSVDKNAEIKEINVYDYNFTGCRSCFACQMKANAEHKGCKIKDGIFELLEEARRCDGLVFGSPVYFFDQTAQLKAFLERLLYPGKSEKTIHSAFIYTMNAPEEIAKQLHFDITLGSAEQFLKANFNAEPQRICSYNTFQYNDKEIYTDGFRSMVNEKKKRHDEQFPIDLQNAFAAGAAMAKAVGNI